MTVVDASILIGHLRGNGAASKLLKDAERSGRILVPAVAAWELWKGGNTPRKRRGIEEILAAIESDPMTAAIAEAAGDLHVRQVRKGNEMTPADAIIAAHALHHDVPLATLDRDYDGVEGLRVLKVA